MKLNITEILEDLSTEPPFIVKNVFYQGQIIILAGEPGVGKSFLSYTIAMSLAGGKKFLGLETATGPVLYLDEENGLPDLTKYIQWAWYGLEQPSKLLLETNLHIEHFSLTKHGSNRYKHMAEIVDKLKPLLIVIDTATPACNIQDENDNGEASRAIKQLRLVKGVAGPQCSMIILKHSRLLHQHKVDEPRTIRGAKTWLGELDGVIYHVGVKGPRKSNGLKDSILVPDKIRAFGLRDKLKITANWTGETNAEMGLVLT